MTLPTNSIIFHAGPVPAEVIRIDAKGFHYRGQFIDDAGEAHRLLVEFLREHQPEGNWQHADAASDKPEPVPVSERLPGPEDCDAEGRCWLLTVEDDYPQWRLHSIQGAQPGGAMIWVPVDRSPGVMVDCFYTSHWLPAHALPLPS